MCSPVMGSHLPLGKVTRSPWGIRPPGWYWERHCPRLARLSFPQLDGQAHTPSGSKEARSRGLAESRARATRSDHTFSTARPGPHRASHLHSSSRFKPHPASTFEATTPIRMRPRKGSVNVPRSFARKSKSWGRVPAAHLACVSRQQVRHRALRTAANAADDRLARQLGSTATALPRAPQLLEGMKGFREVQKHEQLRIKPPPCILCCYWLPSFLEEEFPFRAAQIRLPWSERCFPPARGRELLATVKCIEQVLSPALPLSAGGATPGELPNLSESVSAHRK